jgi:hypothetical protein
MSDVRQALKEEIARLETKAAKLREALAVVDSAEGISSRSAGKKRTMSAAARAKIAKAQKARWKALKAKKGVAA